MEKKYQIFISSTYDDLREARDRVMRAILNLYHLPIGMEMFDASDDEQWSLIKKTIDSSDYYLLIIGHRYGSLTSEGISYTEKEFQYAKEKGIPIYVFIRDENAKTSPAEREKILESIEKLKRFREEAKTGRTVAFWEKPEDLEKSVILSIAKATQHKPQTGWIRADAVDLGEVSEEIINLSKENRELREEIQRLQQYIKVRSPQIQLEINGNNKLEIDCIKRDYIKNYEQMSMSDIPEPYRCYFSEADMDSYNQALKSIDGLEDYNFMIEALDFFEDNKFIPSFSVLNNGTGKANDIKVTIEFPEEVSVFKKDKEFRLPSIEGLPAHPFDAIVDKMRKQNAKVIPLMSTFERAVQSVSPMNIFGDAVDLGVSAYSAIGDINLFNSLEINNNSVFINMRNLLHTDSEIFTDALVLVPKRACETEIKVITICEEYEKPKVQLVPLKINDGVKKVDISRFFK